jgi:hypothetical protein
MPEWNRNMKKNCINSMQRILQNSSPIPERRRKIRQMIIIDTIKLRVE